MLRLIIVDDEKIIRETIYHLIDWESIGIQVISLCKNGIEAYDTILDEYPDIVMTDIKMPGFSGLELIQRISQADQNVEFIILSGYSEFNFAKEAMKYGVKHYLLKPCNEHQIIEVMKEASQDCYKKRALQGIQLEQQSLKNILNQNIIHNIIAEGLQSQLEFSARIEHYGQFFDFTHTNYELYYFYFLEEKNLSECITYLQDYNTFHSPGITLHGVYVQNTLLIFFESYETDYVVLDRYIEDLHFEDEKVSIQYEHNAFINLSLLLQHVIQKISRYEMIYIINGQIPVPLHNYNSFFQTIEKFPHKLVQGSALERENLFMELKELFMSVNDIDFLKALITSLLLKRSTYSQAGCSPISITEFLLEISKDSDVNHIKEMLFNALPSFFSTHSECQSQYKDFIQKTLFYVENNLSNPKLSLKWIAENYLFMNVDYLSKQFIKQTGGKFSAYLTSLRIEKAKALLLEHGSEKIYSVAEEVGCGNNPQYFSQIFKKQTGMPPSEYIKKMNGGI